MLRATLLLRGYNGTREKMASPKFRNKDDHLADLKQKLANFSLKGQLGSVFAFVGHTVSTQLCDCSI